MNVPADSRAAPIDRRWGSLHGPPVSWIPTGRPSASVPTGTVSEGRPHTFCSTVDGMIAARSGIVCPPTTISSGLAVVLGPQEPTGVTSSGAIAKIRSIAVRSSSAARPASR